MASFHNVFTCHLSQLSQPPIGSPTDPLIHPAYRFCHGPNDEKKHPLQLSFPVHPSKHSGQWLVATKSCSQDNPASPPYLSGHVLNVVDEEHLPLRRVPVLPCLALQI